MKNYIIVKKSGKPEPITESELNDLIDARVHQVLNESILDDTEAVEGTMPSNYKEIEAVRQILAKMSDLNLQLAKYLGKQPSVRKIHEILKRYYQIAKIDLEYAKRSTHVSY